MSYDVAYNGGRMVLEEDGPAPIDSKKRAETLRANPFPAGTAEYDGWKDGRLGLERGFGRRGVA